MFVTDPSSLMCLSVDIVDLMCAVNVLAMTKALCVIAASLEITTVVMILLGVVERR